MAQTDLERLTFSIEANLNKLVKNMGDGEKTVDRAAKHIETRMKSAEDYVAKLFGKTNVGEAIEKTFSHIRLGVIEEGATRIPVFGSALEALGPAGFAAALGLAAAALAGEEIKKSLEYAEDLEKTSKTLGVTTTQLQEFDYAASGSSVGIGKAREGLEQFNEVFGKYSSGLANGRTAKFLDALGFTPESARQLGSTVDALDKVLAKLAQIKNPQQRASLAHQLGLAEFLPVLANGQKGVDDFTAAMKRAQGAGAVIAPDQIKRAAELNDQLEQVTHTVSTEMKQAFIDLGPVVLAAAKLVEQLARGISDVVVGFEGIEHANRRQAASAAGYALDQRSAVYNTGAAGKIDPKTGRAGGGILSFAYNNHDDDYRSASARMAAIDKEEADDAKTARGGQAVNLAPPPKPKKAKKGPEDQTADLDKTAADDADNAAKELASARAALTKNIQLHADSEKKAVDAETDKKLKDLADEEVKVRKSKNDAHKAQQLSALAAAQADTQAAAVAKKDLIDRQAELASEEAYEKHQAAVNESMSQIADIAASMAKTMAERYAIERKNLRDNQTRAVQSFDHETEVNRQDGIYSGPNGDTNYASRMEEKQKMLALQGAQRQQQTYQQADPLTQYMRSMNSDVEQSGQKIMVSSLQQMNTALEAGLTNWKNFGQAAKSAVKSVLADMIRLSLEKAELAMAPGVSSLFSSASGGIGSALSSLWGGAHATGGNIGSGKVGLVGEKGPELSIGGSGGSTIIPADITKGMLGAIGAMGGQSAGASSSAQTLHVENHYHLDGAVSDKTVQGMIDRGNQITLQQAAKSFRANFGPEQSRYQLLAG